MIANILFLWVLALGFIPAQVFASTEPPENLLKLERRLWMGPDTDIANVENEIIQALQKNQTSSFIHYLLSHATMRSFVQSPLDIGLLKQAFTLAQQAIDLSPKEEYGYLAMGLCFELSGERKSSSEQFQKIIKNVRSPSWRWPFAKARLVNPGNSQKALALFRRALSTSPIVSRPIIAPFVTQALVHQNKDINEQLSQIKSWNDEFPSPEFRGGLAQRMIAKGMYKDAFKIYDTLLKEESQHWEASINSAALMTKFLKKPEKAYYLLEPQMTDAEKKLDKAYLEAFYFNLGFASLESGRLEEGYNVLAHAYRQSESPESFVEGLYALYLDSPPEVMRSKLLPVVDRLNELTPGQWQLYAFKGDLLSDSTKTLPLSMRAYKDAILLSQDNDQLHEALALAYYKSRDFEKAIESLDKALALNPLSASAYYNKACMEALSNDQDSAVENLKEAFKLDPSLRLNAQKDPDLEDVQKRKDFQFLLTIDSKENLLQVEEEN